MSEPPGSDPGPRRSAQEVRSTTETASQPGLRHLGATKLRARTGDQFTETMNDYLDTFQELQISTMFQPAFWTSIIYRYRQGTRHLPFLRRGTEASIKNMSDDILRGYGGRVWGADSGWRSNLAAGEEMLLYDKDGPNDELHEILAKMWWRMRELVYEEKPAPKKRVRSQPSSRRQKSLGSDTYSEGDGAYQADIDDNNTPSGIDSDAAGTTMAPSRQARAKTVEKLNKVADKLPAPEPGQFLTFQQTEGEIINLIERLHDLRLASKPDIFERLWLAHIGRIEEIEAHVEPYGVTPMGHQVDGEGNLLSTTRTVSGNEQVDEDVPMDDDDAGNPGITTAPLGDKFLTITTDAAALPFPTGLLSDEAIRKRVYANYSAEPFNSAGNPIPPTMTQKHDLPPTLPQVMSIYIMASPPRSPYNNRAWHHPAAPVQEQDQVAFFTQVMERVDHVADKDVKGYVLSYGWCDVARWVAKTVGMGCRGFGNGDVAGESEGERLGWGGFQKDLVEAAQAGVMIWRMKVLVVKK